MTAAELLFDLLMVAVVAYCLARVNLQAVRRERDMYRHDASHNAAVADARHHTACLLYKSPSPRDWREHRVCRLLL